MNKEAIIALVEKLGHNIHLIHAHYVEWTVFAPISWIGFSFCFIAFGFWLVKQEPKRKDFVDEDRLSKDAYMVVKVLQWVLVLVGLLMFVGNLPDLVYPEAKAWHYIFNDLTKSTYQ